MPAKNMFIFIVEKHFKCQMILNFLNGDISPVHKDRIKLFKPPVTFRVVSNQLRKVMEWGENLFRGSYIDKTRNKKRNELDA